MAVLLWLLGGTGESLPPFLGTYVTPLLTGLLVAVVAAGIGEFWLARLQLTPPGRGLAVALAVALGLGSLSFVVMGLALAHILSPGSITAGLALLSVLLPPRESLRRLAEGARDVLGRQCHSLGVGIALALLVLMVVSFLAVGLCPPIDTDSLRYHLRLPELYLQGHTFVYPPRNHFAHFPVGAEMLYAIGLAYAGSPGANMVLVVGGLACLLGIYSVAAHRFSSEAGITAAAIFATTPLVGCLFGTATTDLLVCLYVVLGVGAVMAYEREGGERWLLVAGVCGGLAAVTKLGGGYGAGLLAVWAAISGPRAPGAIARRLLLVAVPTALLLAPWVAKTWVMTGNPIFPFATELLGGRDWRPEYTATYRAEVASYGHMTGDPLDYLLSPIRLAWQWQDYGGAPIGPLYLGLLAGLPLIGRLGRPVWPLAAWCAAFLGTWLVTAQVARFLLPGLAVLALVAGFVAVEVGRPFAKGRPLLPTALAAPLAVMAMATWYWQWKSFEPWPYLTGDITRDQYLGDHADYYLVVRHANQSLPPGSRILFVGETLSYGLRVPALVETGFAGVTAVRLANEARGPGELAQAVAGQGFTHLVVDRQAPRQLWARKLNYFAWRDRAAEERFATMLRRYCWPIYVNENVVLFRLDAQHPRGGGR